ncbi:hypothetical protein Ancab_020162 [Ancistrocladus abbreviatus]
MMAFLLALSLAAASCIHDAQKAVEVIGTAECVDCLGVTIDCKLANGAVKTRGSGLVDEEGNFRVSLPKEMTLMDGKLKEECFARLHSKASNSENPCPIHSAMDMEASKIILVLMSTMKSEKHCSESIFSPAGALKFLLETCTSSSLHRPLEIRCLLPEIGGEGMHEVPQSTTLSLNPRYHPNPRYNPNRPNNPRYHPCWNLQACENNLKAIE